MNKRTMVEIKLVGDEHDQSDLEMKHENARNILGLVGNFFIFFSRLRPVLSTVCCRRHISPYWPFPKPVYSLF